MSKSFEMVIAELQAELLKKNEELSKELDLCVASCFPNEPKDSVTIELHQNLNRSSLQKVKDFEVLVKLEILADAIKEKLNSKNSPITNEELLPAYAWIIQSALVLAQPEALEIFDRREYLEMLGHAATFLTNPNEVNFKALDENMNRLRTPNEEGINWREENASYYEAMKKYCICMAYIAVATLLSGITKAVSLISMLSPRTIGINNIISLEKENPEEVKLSEEEKHDRKDEAKLSEEKKQDRKGEANLSKEYLQKQFQLVFDKNKTADSGHDPRLLSNQNKKMK